MNKPAYKAVVLILKNFQTTLTPGQPP
jgi:hypothetical protein